MRARRELDGDFRLRSQVLAGQSVEVLRELLFGVQLGMFLPNRRWSKQHENASPFNHIADMRPKIELSSLVVRLILLHSISRATSRNHVSCPSP
jgi:hypothetical protein